jgi:hypothetical protein
VISSGVPRSATAADQPFAFANDARAHDVFDVLGLADRRIETATQIADQRGKHPGDGPGFQRFSAGGHQINRARGGTGGAERVVDDAFEEEVGFDMLGFGKHFADIVNEAENDLLFLQELVADFALPLPPEVHVSTARREQTDWSARKPESMFGLRCHHP